VRGAARPVLETVEFWWCFTSVCLGVGAGASAYSLLPVFVGRWWFPLLYLFLV